MATINQVFASIVEQVSIFSQTNLANPATIITALGTGLTQVTIGVFVTILAAVMREVLRPIDEKIATVGTNIQGQTNTLSDKADEFLNQRNQTPKIKPDAPEPFDGKSEHVMSFLAPLTVYFNTLKETNNKNMILFALSKIKGGKESVASRWADAVRIEIVNYNSTIAKGTGTNASTAAVAATAVRPQRVSAEPSADVGRVQRVFADTWYVVRSPLLRVARRD